MYLFKDTRSFMYKLTPEINDGDISTNLRDHKKLKSEKIISFKEFEKKHGHQYIGLENRLLRDPHLFESLPNNENLLRIYMKKVKRALNSAYVQKNKLTDAIYRIEKRSNYLKRMGLELSNEKLQYTFTSIQDDLEKIQEVTTFIKYNNINRKELPDVSIEKKFYTIAQLKQLTNQLDSNQSIFESFKKMINERIVILKKVKNEIKKNILHDRFPDEMKRKHNKIKENVGFSFFLNRWITNYFIINNFSLDSINDIKNEKSSGGYNISKSGQHHVLLKKLRRGHSSNEHTVFILHEKIGTPEAINDRTVRNAAALASYVLKSQEDRLKTMKQVHEHFETHVSELKTLLTKQKRPSKLYNDLKSIKYFLLDNVVRAYASNIKVLLKVLRADPIANHSTQEIEAHFKKVFENLFHRTINAFLAHDVNDRTPNMLRNFEKLYLFVSKNLQISRQLQQDINSELAKINFDGFLNQVSQYNFAPTERIAFISHVKWCLSNSYLLYKIKNQARDLEKEAISHKMLNLFKNQGFFMNVPIVKGDILPFYGDDSIHRFDNGWKAQKLCGATCEIINLNASPSNSLKVKVRLLDDLKNLYFQEFKAPIPEVQKWFSYNYLVKQMIEAVLNLLNVKKIENFYLIEQRSFSGFEKTINTVYRKYEKKFNDDFQSFLIHQLYMMILDHFQACEEKNDEESFKKLYKLLLEPIPVPILNKLLKKELENLKLSDFGPTLRTKIIELNKKNLPLERVNITQLKGLFRNHSSECPEVLISKFSLYQVKNYVFQKKHIILKKKNKILISIPLEIHVPIIQTDSKKIVGVDWGIRKDLSASIFNYSTFSFEDSIQLDESNIWEKILITRDNVARLQRVKAQVEGNFLRKGKFYSKYSDLITMHGNKNSNRIKYLAHSISRNIVNWSIDNECKIFATESLKSLRPERGKLSRLLNFRVTHSPRAILLNQIEMKMKRYGGKVYNVNAKNTSRYSSMLILNAIKSNGKSEKWYGYTDQGYRTNSAHLVPPPKEAGGEFFYHEKAPLIDADLNASCNIAMKLFHHFK